MQKSRKLDLIQSEPNPQKRLSLLVNHGFKDEASEMVRELVHGHTTMFHNDWHDKAFCKPLERVTKESSAVYVICCSRSKFDYHPYPHLHTKDEWHIVFELGWEQKVLGWSKKESQDLVRQICAQALIRPLNQWEFKQAEGTGRAARETLHAEDPIAQEVAALHMVYHLREADFYAAGPYLSKIKGYPDMNGSWSNGFEVQDMIDWIVARLLEFGWSNSRICKELLEWMSLKTNTNIGWLLAVAMADGVFYEGNLLRATALRRWVRQGFDSFFRGIPQERDNADIVNMYERLFILAELTHDDGKWMAEKLAMQMASGRVAEVKWFVRELYESILGYTFDLNNIRTHAQEIAKSAGNYGLLIGLMKDGKQEISAELREQVEILAQHINLG